MSIKRALALLALLSALMPCALSAQAAPPAAGEASVTLSWSPVEGAGGYTLELSTLSGAAVSSTTVEGTKATISAPPGDYLIRIVSLNHFMRPESASPWKKISIVRKGKPKFESLSPDFVEPGKKAVIALRGKNVDASTVATLRKAGGKTAIKASSVRVIDSSTIELSFPPIKEVGSYSLELLNKPDYSLLIPEALRVKHRDAIVDKVEPAELDILDPSQRISIRGRDIQPDATISLEGKGKRIALSSLSRSAAGIEAQLPRGIEEGSYDLIIENDALSVTRTPSAIRLSSSVEPSAAVAPAIASVSEPAASVPANVSNSAPVAEPVAAVPAAATVAVPVSVPAAEPITSEPAATAPVAVPAASPVATPAPEPAAAHAAAPIVKPAAEPIAAAPVATSVATPAAEPVAEPVAAPAAQPAPAPSEPSVASAAAAEPVITETPAIADTAPQVTPQATAPALASAVQEAAPTPAAQETAQAAAEPKAPAAESGPATAAEAPSPAQEPILLPSPEKPSLDLSDAFSLSAGWSAAFALGEWASILSPSFLNFDIAARFSLPDWRFLPQLSYGAELRAEASFFGTIAGEATYVSSSFSNYDLELGPWLAYSWPLFDLGLSLGGGLSYSAIEVSGSNLDASAVTSGYSVDPMAWGGLEFDWKPIDKLSIGIRCALRCVFFTDRSLFAIPAGICLRYAF
jgi:hypothetical protein